MNRCYLLAIAGFVVVLLAGCAAEAPKPEPEPEPEPVPAVVPPEEPPSEICSPLTGRCLKPSEIRPITIKTDCSYRDPTGYGGKLKLEIAESQVNNLQAEIQTKRGKCKFVFKDFRQATKEPSITLLATKGRCIVRVWEQEGKLMVAFDSCRDRCQSDSFNYVWPILINTKTGKCS
jgi:hypothetical protein